MRTPFITCLSAQSADWNDLALPFQEAALAVWETEGSAAKNLFCLGA